MTGLPAAPATTALTIFDSEMRCGGSEVNGSDWRLWYVVDCSGGGMSDVVVEGDERSWWG
jgi:hypothetical protein